MLGTAGSRSGGTGVPGPDRRVGGNLQHDASGPERVYVPPQRPGRAPFPVSIKATGSTPCRTSSSGAPTIAAIPGASQPLPMPWFRVSFFSA